jgi:Cu2+-exporting ATPase
MQYSLKEELYPNLDAKPESDDDIPPLVTTSHRPASHITRTGHDHSEECGCGHTDDPDAPWWKNYWFKGFVGIAWGIGLLILPLLKLDLPTIALYCITGATGLATLFLGYQTYFSGLKKLFQEKTLTMNLLYMISTLAILGVSIGCFFIPWLPKMEEAAPLILGIWHIGEAIEHALKKKITAQASMRDLAPKKITRIIEGQHSENVFVEELWPGDVIQIQAGSIIPVDGECLEEDTLLHTKHYNGLFSSTRFSPGNPILAGMSLVGGSESKKIKVTKRVEDSFLQRVDNNIKAAKDARNKTDKKAPIELFTDTLLRYFIPSLLFFAALSSILVGYFFTPSLAIQCAIAVLVSVCPCALSLITPLAVRIGIRKAADQGIYFKDGKTLQEAGNTKIAIFDINGTLTLGNPKVTSTCIYKDAMGEDAMKLDTFLQHIALLEKDSMHSTAIAIRNYVESREIKEDPALQITDVVPSPCGITASINKEAFLIGNASMLASHGIALPEEPIFEETSDEADLADTIYLVKERVVVGKISVMDRLRPDAKKTVTALKNVGIEVHLCTGASQKIAESYAKALGIRKEHVAFDRTSVENDQNKLTKVHYIAQLRDDKPTQPILFCGDGANDVSAIITSDVGIAMQSGISPSIAVEEADATIKNLVSILTALEVSKKTKQNIYQSLGISLTYNTCISLVAGGLFVILNMHLNPIVGIALMVLETSIVLLNTYRFKHQKLSTHETAENEERELGSTTYKRLNQDPPDSPMKKHDDTHTLDPFKATGQPRGLSPPQAPLRQNSFLSNPQEGMNMRCRPQALEVRF